MSQVIILTDTVLNGEVGGVRYIGPYAIATSLRKNNITTTVIDHFTKIRDLKNYLSNFLTSETAVLAVSSTFLAPFSSIKTSKKNRTDGLRRYYSGELCFETGAELKAWTSQIKDLLQEKNPRAKLVLGGVKSQFAIWRKEFYSDFDYICIGAADISFPHFVKKVINNEAPETKNILDFKNIIDNSADLSNKNCPVNIWEKSDAIQVNEALPIEISRGCVFNCKFCHYDKKESNRKPAELLFDELVSNYEKFGTTVYAFCDDCFNDHPKKVEMYCELFKKLPFKIEWTAYARVDVAVKFPHTIDMMVDSGARGLYWGLESFHPVVARNAGKGTPTELVKNFLLEFKNKYRGQCLSEGSFIVGLPGEDKASNLETLDWILQNDPLDLATFGPLGLMPYVPTLDKVLFDYADYSKNPEKYGFNEVRFQPHYWSHDLMNSNEANELATHMSKTFRSYFNRGFLKNIWLYPHARSLGLNHLQTMEAFWSFDKKAFYENEITARFQQQVKKYHHTQLECFKKYGSA